MRFWSTVGKIIFGERSENLIIFISIIMRGNYDPVACEDFSVVDR